MLVLVLISLATAFCAPFLHRLIGRHVILPMALLALGIFVYFCTLFLPVLRQGAVSQHNNWVPALAIDLQFRVDGLSLLFALLISFFGLLIIVYASGYFHNHPLLGRFYLYLIVFMTAMLGLVTSDNIFCLFIFWELTSISSYLLIGFNNTQNEARTAAWQALLVTSFGGLALMAGLVLLSVASGSYTFSGIIENKSLLLNHAFFLPSLLLIMLGCFTKSAQFPFHFWLPNAMQAPTPVSAYLHSATMVKAGIYLLARLSPLFAASEVWEYGLILVGGSTALLGAALALQHTDLKAILAYTTFSALGLMVTMIGIGTVVALKAM